MKPYDLYAFVAETLWNETLHAEWPYASSVNGYRLIVFSSDNIPSIELVELGADQVIEAMEEGEAYAFICNLEEARTVVDSFKVLSDMTKE